MGSLQDRFVRLMLDSSLYVNHIYKQCQIMKKYLVCLKITNVYKISLKRDCNVSISHIWQHMLTSSHTESDTNIVISNKEIKIAFDITDVIMLNIKHHADFFICIFYHSERQYSESQHDGYTPFLYVRNYPHYS